MVGDGGHQAESCRKRSVHVGVDRQRQNGEVLGRAEERRDQPVEGALEGPEQGCGRQQDVHDGAQDGEPAAVRGECGGCHDDRSGDEGDHGRGDAREAARETGQVLGERAGVGEVRQRPGGAVRAARLAGERAQDPARRGVGGREGAADEQRVEGDTGVVSAVRTAIIAHRSPMGRTIIRRTQTVQPTLSSLSERAAVGLVLAVASWFASLKEKSTTCRQVWRIIAPRASAHTSSPPRAAPSASPGVVGVLLGAVEGRVQPGAERGVLQGVAGELSVRAVQDEGEHQQQTGHDEAGAGAGGGAAAAISAVISEAVVTWFGVRPRRAHQRAM